jgi:hypothetical protein
MKALGFRYVCVGRGFNGEGSAGVSLGRHVEETRYGQLVAPGLRAVRPK